MPYIDVMLVLLVIFMITAPLINPGQRIAADRQVAYASGCTAGGDHQAGRQPSAA